MRIRASQTSRGAKARSLKPRWTRHFPGDAHHSRMFPADSHFFCSLSGESQALRTQLWKARAEVGAEAMGGVRLSTLRAGVASGQKVASDDPDNRAFILCAYNGSADANRQTQTRTQTSRTQNATRSTLNSGQSIKCYGWERPRSCRPWRYAVKTRSRRSCIR